LRREIVVEKTYAKRGLYNYRQCLTSSRIGAKYCL